MMETLDFLEFRNAAGTYRPRGRHSLVGAVDLVSRANAQCRDRHVYSLLVDITDLVDVPVPSQVDAG